MLHPFLQRSLGSKCSEVDHQLIKGRSKPLFRP